MEALIVGLSIRATLGRRSGRLSEVTKLLADIDLAAAQTRSMADAASLIAEAVKAGLSVEPGCDHSRPWMRTGELRDSITHSSDTVTAIVGSDSTVALAQENGTRRIPPRPFLAPVAALLSEQCANNIGIAVAREISGEDA